MSRFDDLKIRRKDQKDSLLSNPVMLDVQSVLDEPKSKVENIPDLTIKQIKQEVQRQQQQQQQEFQNRLSFLTKAKFWIYVCCILSIYCTVVVTWNTFFKQFLDIHSFDEFQHGISWTQKGKPISSTSSGSRLSSGISSKYESRVVGDNTSVLAEKLNVPYPMLELTDTGTTNRGFLLGGGDGGILYNRNVDKWYFFNGAETVNEVPVSLSNVVMNHVELNGNLRCANDTLVVRPERIDVVGDLYLNGSSLGQMTGTAGLTTAGHLLPTVDATYNVGSAQFQWNTIWGKVYETSDERYKQNIETCSLGLDFITKLKPIQYTQECAVKKHLGLSAQNVEQVLAQYGMSSQTMHVLKKEESEEGRLSLKYTELIAPLINAIIELNEKVRVLQDRRDLLLHRIGNQ